MAAAFQKNRVSRIRKNARRNGAHHTKSAQWSWSRLCVASRFGIRERTKIGVLVGSIVEQRKSKMIAGLPVVSGGGAVSGLFVIVDGWQCWQVEESGAGCPFAGILAAPPQQGQTAGRPA